MTTRYVNTGKPHFDITGTPKLTSLFNDMGFDTCEPSWDWGNTVDTNNIIHIFSQVFLQSHASLSPGSDGEVVEPRIDPDHCPAVEERTTLNNGWGKYRELHYKSMDVKLQPSLP